MPTTFTREMPFIGDFSSVPYVPEFAERLSVPVSSVQGDDVFTVILGGEIPESFARGMAELSEGLDLDMDAVLEGPPSAE
jgi:hypothetical protein